MSRVFVATETAFGRRVVVKVLPPELAASVSKERFRREIQLAAKLHHPYIVSALTAGVLDDVLYYTMPFLEGESLRARLQREKALSCPDTVRILTDIAEALAYAHRNGVVHRDIKPENILLLEGHAMVADFGVARAIKDASTTSGLTSAGVSLGTPTYMAPEQVAADPDIDHRADLYSLGAVAYEMLTGRPPFVASTPQQVLAAHIHQTPEHINRLRTGIPAPLARIVMRCLEKHPADRYRNAEELLQELNILSTPSGGIGVDTATAAGWQAIRRRSRRLPLVLGTALVAAAAVGAGTAMLRVTGSDYTGWVAVMPLRTDGELANLPGIGLSLADQIGEELTRENDIRVVSRTSVDAVARRGDLTVPQLADTLHVRHVVGGSVRAVGKDSIHITVTLVDAPADAQRWSQSFIGPTSQLSAMQTDMAHQVVATLLSQIGDGNAATPRAHAARAGEATESYLRGKRAMAPRTPAAIAEALANFEEAITLDSTDARARAQLAATLALSVTYSYRGAANPYATLSRALALADDAVRLAPDVVEAHTARGYVALVGQAPVVEVHRAFDRALALAPNAPDVPGWRASLLAREGRVAEALREARRAVQLDPLGPARRVGYAWDALRARRYNEAFTEATRAVELQPGLMLPRAIAARARLLGGQRCADLEVGPYLGVRALCLQAAGTTAEAGRVVDTLHRMARDPSLISPLFNEALPAQELATYYAWTGDVASARTWLQAAFERSPAGVDVRTIESGMFDRVLADPSFREELDRLQKGVWAKVVAGAKKR